MVLDNAVSTASLRHYLKWRPWSKLCWMVLKSVQMNGNVRMVPCILEQIKPQAIIFRLNISQTGYLLTLYRKGKHHLVLLSLSLGICGQTAKLVEITHIFLFSEASVGLPVTNTSFGPHQFPFILTGPLGPQRRWLEAPLPQHPCRRNHAPHGDLLGGGEKPSITITEDKYFMRGLIFLTKFDRHAKKC